MKTIKLLFTVLLLLCATVATAYDFNSQGIYYNITSDETVEVTYNSGSKYTGIVRIPSSVTYKGTVYSITSIGGSAFSNCTGLTSIIVDKNNPVYDSRDNCNAIIETASNTLICACQNTIIPNSVTSIGDAAFYGCTGLTSIEIGNSVTSIGDWAFWVCTGLTSIEIGNSITWIGYYAFCDCKNIFEIKIGLKEAISASKTIFSETAYNNACLYVPVGSKDSYAKTSPWSYFDIKEMDFTGIENVFDDIKGENGNTETIYNLNGCAVENPTNGIYIINGKKVLVK